jgi:hypothetical protein
MSITEIRKKYRIFNIAIFDLVLAFIGVIFIFMIFWRIFFKSLPWWHFVLAAIILTIPIGIVFHIIFGVKTQLNYYLGLSDKSNNI